MQSGFCSKSLRPSLAALRRCSSQSAIQHRYMQQRSAQDGTLDLESRAEQKHRHRIWKNKVEGYKQFHAELLSMDHLLETLKEARTKSQDYLMDEEEGGAKATTQEQPRMYARPHSSGPAGTRSFHTTRQILHSPKPHTAPNKVSLKPDNSSVFAKKNNTALKMLRSRPLERIELFSKKEKSPLQRHQSLMMQADLPTEAEILEHVSKSASEHIHVPIDSSVNVGDIVEMRLNMSANPSKEFGSSVYLGAIAQKTTGRFHLMSIDEEGNVFGSRENVLGFVAK
ncbi:hypothetical protein LPJ76_006284, partial [Coemansia sp. RSA 638]